MAGKKGMKRYSYTEKEVRFLRENVRGRCYAELAWMFNKKFGHSFCRERIGKTIQKLGLSNGLNGRPRRPIGAESIRKGIAYVKASNTKARGKRWRSRHSLIWEGAHGKVPKGHVVIFADGDRRNYDLKNLLLVSRAELAQLNKKRFLQGDGDLAKAGLLVAKIKILARKKMKKRGPRPPLRGKGERT